MLILKFFSYIFLFFVKLRILFYKIGILKSYKIEGVKIVSIGNISLGGTGKTPITIKIAQNLIKKGYSVSILLRGYKGEKNKKPLLVHNGKEFLSNVEICGDEAYLIAKKLSCPVIVSRDRVIGAKYIKDNFKPDFILLDDGFQHLKLKRDKDILLITESSLKDKIYVLPAGRYREPLSHIKRADTIIITKYSKPISPILITKIKKYTHNPIYLAKMQIKYFLDIKNNRKIEKEKLQNEKVVIFSGLADNKHFEETLKNIGLTIFKKFEYPDHYKYSAKDINKFNKFEKTLITTEKDAVKIDISKITSPLMVSVIEYSFHKT